MALPVCKSRSDRPQNLRVEVESLIALVRDVRGPLLVCRLVGVILQQIPVRADYKLGDPNLSPVAPVVRKQIDAVAEGRAGGAKVETIQSLSLHPCCGQRTRKVCPGMEATPPLLPRPMASIVCRPVRVICHRDLADGQAIRQSTAADDQARTDRLCYCLLHMENRTDEAWTVH